GRLASLGESPFEVRIVDMTTGRPLSPPLKHPNHVIGVRFSPDGRRLITHGAWPEERSRGLPGPGQVRFWDVQTGELLLPAVEHFGEGFPLRSGLLEEFSPDGRRVLLDRDWRTQDIWELPEADPRPVEDLVQLAQALSGRRIDEAGGLVPLPAGHWQG